MFPSLCRRRCFLLFWIIYCAAICITSIYCNPLPNVNAASDARKSFLLLCLADGTIVSLEAWTGIHQSVVSSEPLLQTHYASDSHQDDDASSVMILPGLDGRLYYKPPPSFEDSTNTISEAPPLQELPLSMAALLENPVRSCQPVGMGASESTDVSCGILTAQADVSLLALSAQTGTIKWQSGNGMRQPKNSKGESGPVLLLQRKDHMIQYVRTQDGQQLWNVSLGAYQALDFDLSLQQSDIQPRSKGDDGLSRENANDRYRMLLDDDDDATNNGDERFTPFSSLNQQRDPLPVIVFHNNGQTIAAIHPADGSVLWRQDVPSTLASVFGIADGQWQTIPIMSPPPLDNDRLSQSHVPVPQQHNIQAAIDLAEYERFLWEQRWSMLSSKPEIRALPKALPGRVDAEIHTFDTDLCWIEEESQWGMCPIKDDMSPFLQLPSPSAKAVVVLADGLLLSWSIVVLSVIGSAIVVLIVVRFWYLRKKSQWIKMHTEMTQHAQNVDVVGVIIETPILSDNEAKSGNIPTISTKPSSLNPSDRTKSNDYNNIDGIPLVRYSRYASEFQELHALGKGGFGSVFQCQNNLDGRQYAVKKVSILSSSDDFQQKLHRVLREVKILAVLDHPNIVRYYTAWLEIEEQEQNQLMDGIGEVSEQVGDTTVGTLSRRRSFSSSILLQAADDFRQFDRHTQKNPLGWSNGLDISDSSSLVLPRRRSLQTVRRDEDFMIFEDSKEGEMRSTSGTDSQNHEESCLSRRRASGYEAAGDDCCDYSVSLTPTPGQKGVDDCDTSIVAVVVRRTLYIQMQLCSQKTLSEFLGDRNSRCETGKSSNVDIPKALRIFLQIAEATAYVHACGLIHRDLKPNNCFMDDTCSTVKVGDFGLSRESNGDDEGVDHNYNDLSGYDTHEDHTAGVGTRSYASPEQLNGSNYDCSADVYSLGIILFELLYPMYTGMERQKCFSKLRDHVFPSNWDLVVGSAFPTVKPFVIDMLCCTPSNRPSAGSVVRYTQSILGEFKLVSLDLQHVQSPDIFLLRVEAEHRDDVLQQTMQLIRDESSAATISVDVVQYGMRSSRASNNEQPTAIMEFALRFNDLSGMFNLDGYTSDLVRNLSRRPEVLNVRQVSNKSVG